MATRFLTRSLLTTTKQSLISSFPRSFISASLSTTPTSFLRLRPLIAVAANFRQALSSSSSVRGFSTRRTSSSLNDPNPNWSNRPPKETILLDGCDFEHWLVVVEKPEGDLTRDEIIDSYIKTLATVVGSEEEARMKIYSVSTRHYFAFGALVSEELSFKLKELEKVRWVLPDSYLDVKNKDYGGEPFINGQAVPYDPKYHEEWVRNNARANERNRRNDRPRNFDRSRNFERRREMPSNGGPNMGGAPVGPNMPPNMSGPPNMANVQPGQPNIGGAPPNYMSGPPNNAPNNFRPPNMGPNNMTGPPPNMRGGMQGNNMGAPPPSNYNGGAPPSNYNGGAPPSNYNGGAPPSNYNGGRPYNTGGTGNAQTFQHGNAETFQQGNVPMNNGIPYQSAPGQQQNNYAPNQPGGYPYQTQNQNQNQNQNLPGRDVPPV